MVWRSVVIAGYVALGIAVGISYGGRGLATLGFFYFCAGAWVLFILLWNWASREAGRRYARRLVGPPRS
jgi:hypothetical protein